MALDLEAFNLSVNFHCSFSYMAVPDSTHPANSERKSSTRCPAATPKTLVDPRIAASTTEHRIDRREASLSPTARQMQYRARRQYSHRLGRPTQSEDVQRPHSIATDQLDTAARMDRESLEALEAAVATSLNSRGQHSRNMYPRPALQRFPALQTGAGRLYEGTSPYQTPTTPTGTAFEIHSIPTNLPSTPSVSKPSKPYSSQISSPLKGRPESPPDPVGGELSLQQALAANGTEHWAEARIRGWLRTSEAERHSTTSNVSENDDVSLFENVMQLASSSSDAQTAEEALRSLGAADGASGNPELPMSSYDQPDHGEGYSCDSWSQYTLEDERADGFEQLTQPVDVDSRVENVVVEGFDWHLVTRGEASIDQS